MPIATREGGEGEKTLHPSCAVSKHSPLASSAQRRGVSPPPHFRPRLIYTHTHTELIMHVRRKSVTCTDRQDSKTVSFSGPHHKCSRTQSLTGDLECQGTCNKWCPWETWCTETSSCVQRQQCFKGLHSQWHTVQQGAAVAAFETAELTYSFNNFDQTTNVRLPPYANPVHVAGAWLELSKRKEG